MSADNAIVVCAAGARFAVFEAYASDLPDTEMVDYSPLQAMCSYCTPRFFDNVELARTEASALRAHFRKNELILEYGIIDYTMPIEGPIDFKAQHKANKVASKKKRK